MKTLNTSLGQVIINDARIGIASGFGQYNITVDIEFEGEKKTLNVHSTDSELFDKAYGEANHSEIVLENANYLIEREVENYINSL